MSLFILAAAAVATVANPPATTTTPNKGYEAHVSASGLMCLRPTTGAAVARFDIPRGQQVCRAMTHWEDAGLRFHFTGAKV